MLIQFRPKDAGLGRDARHLVALEFTYHVFLLR